MVKDGTYRIVTNGSMFRVQRMKIHTFLFWRWEWWEFVTWGGEDEIAREYASYADARTAVLSMIREDEIESAPWVEVNK